MPKITLYGKAGCCLCEDARAALELVAATHDFELAEVDVALDPVLMRRYGERIPVVEVDGREHFELEVRAEAVRGLLDRLAA